MSATQSTTGPRHRLAAELRRQRPRTARGDRQPAATAQHTGLTPVPGIRHRYPCLAPGTAGQIYEEELAIMLATLVTAHAASGSSPSPPGAPPVRCLAQSGFASKGRPFATIQRRCREAITLAERHGWGAEWFIAPALIALADTMVRTGEFDEAEQWLQRTARVVQADAGPDIRLLVAMVTGMLAAGRGCHAEALQEFNAAEYLGSQLADSRTLASQVTGWMLAAQARAGMPGEARAALAAFDAEQAGSGEIRNAHAVICLADGDPAAALAAVRDVLDGTAPVIGHITLVEAHLLAGLAHRELGDQRAAYQAAERALALAEPDRLVLPFAMTGSRELLEALPRHETAHAALLADILDVLHGSSPAAGDQPPPPDVEELSPGELRVLRYLPTNLSRPEIAGELSVSPNTVGTHLRSIYAKLRVSDRSSAVQRARELRLLAAGRER
jgi:LuxR family transcriptional regulator, maltose regulon positive regulatory protein